MATSTDLRAAIDEVNRSLPPKKPPGAGPSRPKAVDDVERRVGALPWWVISAAVHAVAFLLLALLAVAVAPPRLDEVVMATDVAKQKPPEYDPAKKRDLFKNVKEVQAETQVDNPVVTHEKTEESDRFETDNNTDKRTARGNEDAISDIPLGGTGTVGSIGVGSGGLAGVFGYRDGSGRKNAVGRFGGSEATESSVEAALRWLARHQEPEGCWRFDRNANPKNTMNRVGLTGLALLAFLGAGYTEKSAKFGDNVKRAEQWLIKQQKANGAICEPWMNAFALNRGVQPAAPADGKPVDLARDPTLMSCGYHHAIAGLALAEAFGMGRDPEIGQVAQKAVDYSKEHQAPYSGWRYSPKMAADVSVTGWFVMQYKSAKVAGLKVDGAGFQGATAFLDSITDKDGLAGYTARVGPVPAAPAVAAAFSDKTVCRTSVGLVCRQFMGTPNTDPLLKSAAEAILKERPAWQAPLDPKAPRVFVANKGEQSFYYWYYGTLGMFQMGGDGWKKWNEAIKPTLVDHQCKGGPMDGSKDDKDGSWDAQPQGWFDSSGGRVYTTAMGALTLEVYYRYLPMYTK